MLFALIARDGFGSDACDQDRAPVEWVDVEDLYLELGGEE